MCRVSDIRHFFTTHFYGLRLASSSSRTCGSYLYVPLFHVSLVTIPIYLALSLPLSCEISYNSFMQISHGRERVLSSAPLNPNGVISNFTIHQLHPLFFAQTSRNEPRTVIPSFTSSSGHGRRGSRVFIRFRSSALKWKSVLGEVTRILELLTSE